MAQQTAVEWLFEKMLDDKDDMRYELLEQAKKMEKEQIKDAWHDGNFLGRSGNLLADYMDCDGYYKSEYQGKKYTSNSQFLNYLSIMIHKNIRDAYREYVKWFDNLGINKEFFREEKIKDINKFADKLVDDDELWLMFGEECTINLTLFERYMRTQKCRGFIFPKIFMEYEKENQTYRITIDELG